MQSRRKPLNADPLGGKQIAVIESILLTQAEVTIAIAGFASVAAALRRPLSVIQRQRIFVILATSLLQLFGCLVPLCLLAVGESDSEVWQTVSILYLVFSLALGIGVVYHGRTLSRAEMVTINLPLTIFVNSLALLLYGLLIVNLAFLPKPGFALYYLALLAGMTAMFVTFADVATRDDE